jgi:hypothetical protein
MSLLLALLVAASPAAAAPETAAKKPRLKCEWIHEVGTSRPRRVCEKRVEPKPAEQAKDDAQSPQLAPKAEPAQGSDE